jgi:hypothetical protein
MMVNHDKPLDFGLSPLRTHVDLVMIMRIDGKVV